MLTLLFSMLTEARAVDMNRRQALGFLGGGVAAAKVRIMVPDPTPAVTQVASTATRAGWANSRQFRKHLIIDHLRLSRWDDLPKWREANLVEGIDPSGSGRTVRIFVSPVGEDSVLERAEQMENLEDELSGASGLGKDQLWARIDDRAAFVDFCEPVPHAKVSDAYLEELVRRVKRVSPSLGWALSARFERVYAPTEDHPEQLWRARVWSCLTDQDMAAVQQIEDGVRDELGRSKQQVWEEASYLLRPDHELPWSLNYRARRRPVDSAVRNELLIRMQDRMPRKAEWVKSALSKIESDAHGRYFFDPDFVTNEALDALEQDSVARFPGRAGLEHSRYAQIVQAKARLERWAPARVPHGLAGSLDLVLKADDATSPEVATPQLRVPEPIALIENATDCSLDLGDVPEKIPVVSGLDSSHETDE